MRIVVALLLAAASPALVACGSSSSSAGTSPANTSTAPHAPAPGQEVIQLRADAAGAQKCDRSSASTLAGKVQLSMANPSSRRRQVAIKGSGVDKKGPAVPHGGVSIVNVQLRPGTYAFYCAGPGRESAATKGTLRVGTA
jgi:hypothetical protein